MPIKPRELEGDVPTKPHFALLINEMGQRMPIPPGASLWIVEDPADQSRIFPLTLKKVTHDMISFEMADAQGGVTEYRYELTTAKALNRAALKRLVSTGKKVQR